MPTRELPKLDWISEHDPASADYPIRPLLAAAAVEPPKTKEWAGPYVRLDQGSEGACVGFGWAIELMSSPHRFRPPGYYSTRRGGVAAANAWALQQYHLYQDNDQWPGHDYDGTSVIAGARTLKEQGHLAEYRWAETIADIRDAVLLKGPVVLGIPWYSNMYDTDAEGLVDIGGRLVGGHCICVTARYARWRRRSRIYRWRNSWGPSYGINGDGFIEEDALEQLVFADVPEVGGPGEACIPVEVAA